MWIDVHLPLSLDQGVAHFTVISEDRMRRHQVAFLHFATLVCPGSPRQKLWSPINGLYIEVYWAVTLYGDQKLNKKKICSSILGVKWLKLNPFMQEITALKPPENVGRSVGQKWQHDHTNHRKQPLNKALRTQALTSSSSGSCLESLAVKMTWRQNNNLVLCLFSFIYSWVHNWTEHWRVNSGIELKQVYLAELKWQLLESHLFWLKSSTE